MICFFSGKLGIKALAVEAVNARVYRKVMLQMYANNWDHLGKTKLMLILIIYLINY